MNKNEGTIDRVLRVILGIVLLYVGFFVMSGTWGTLVGLIGFIPLLTGALGWCPLYGVFGLNTK